ncbi:MAG: hypothetical protein ACOYJC_11450 [Christensenellales bacterium]|jgi:hypothetical protein
MAQGVLGGATSYEEQSLTDIMGDLENWADYAIRIKEYISNSHLKLVESEFWPKIAIDFQLTLVTTIRYCDTIIEDIRLIQKAIQDEQITNKEVNLLYKIGQNSVKYNYEYGKTYNDDDRWKDYGNSDFRVAEDAYAKGRDVFVTLQDAGNAAERLRDYMDEGITRNNINIGGDVVNSPIQQGKGNIMSVDNNTIDIAQLNEILENIVQLSDAQSKEQIEESVGIIHEELKKAKPKKSIIRTAMASLKAVKGSIEFLAAVATLATYIASIS